MKIVVIGGAHAGLSAVNAFRQVNETDEVVILEKNLRERPFISAGIKLALNGRVTSAEQVNFEHFEGQPNTTYRSGVLVERVYAAAKKVYARTIDNGSIIEESYDKLICALGSSARVPSFVGADLDRVVFVKDEQDAVDINKFAKGFRKRALVYGGGPVSTELAAALAHSGVHITFVTRSKRLMTRYFDQAIQEDLEKTLTDNKVVLRKGQEVVSVDNQGKKIEVNFNNGTSEVFDFMAIAAGLQPNTMLLAGQVDMRENGAIVVDDTMKSSNPDIYAIGDSAVVDGKFDQYFPLMSAALKMGRVAGYAVAGLDVKIQPILRTIGFSIFDRFFYKTGLTVEAAKERIGDHIERLDIHTPATIHALGEQTDIVASLIYDYESGIVYGAQISTNAPAAAEVITTLSHAVSSGLTVTELAFLDTYFESEINLPYSVANRLGEMGVIAEAKRAAGKAIDRDTVDGDDNLNGFQ
ncbi:FAD-dependent oxidoreductase [Weissella cibaria]